MAELCKQVAGPALKKYLVQVLHENATQYCTEITLCSSVRDTVWIPEDAGRGIGRKNRIPFFIALGVVCTKKRKSLKFSGRAATGHFLPPKALNASVFLAWKFLWLLICPESGLLKLKRAGY